jgi:hypothetical protein
MTVFANRNNYTQLTFVVANINASKKSVTLFNKVISYLGTVDLMKMRGVSETDVRDSLTKGDLRVKIDNGDLRVLSSNINLITFDDSFKAWLSVNGVPASTTSGGGGAIVVSGSVGTYDCDASIAIGDVVYLSDLINGNIIDKADADDAIKQPLIGVVDSKPSVVQAIVKYSGEITGLSGLIPGSTYYLDIVPGKFTVDAPSSPGSIVQKVGFAKNSTTLVVLIDRDYTVN